MTLIQRQIQNIYLWEYVEPSHTYDFRTLSLAELQAQWWASWSQTRLDSNWLMNNDSGNDKYDAALYCPINISRANHLYIKMTWYYIRWSWAWWPWLWINNQVSHDTWYRLATWIWMNSNGWYQGQSIYLEWWDLVNQQYWFNTWDYTLEFDIDFVSWAVSSKRSWAGSLEQNATLNSTQISTLKSGTKYIYCQIWHWVYQAHRTYTLEYVIS